MISIIIASQWEQVKSIERLLLWQFPIKLRKSSSDDQPSLLYFIHLHCSISRFHVITKSINISKRYQQSEMVAIILLVEYLDQTMETRSTGHCVVMNNQEKSRFFASSVVIEFGGPRENMPIILRLTLGCSDWWEFVYTEYHHDITSQKRVSLLWLLTMSYFLIFFFGLACGHIWEVIVKGINCFSQKFKKFCIDCTYR